MTSGTDNIRAIPQKPIAEYTEDSPPFMFVQKRKGYAQPGYYGTTFLPDGRLIASDSNNNLCCLLDSKCNVIADIKLPSQPRSLATIGKSEVAVVLPLINQIQVVTIDAELTLSRTIPCSDRSPRCVARAGDGLLAVGWENGFSIISLDDGSDAAADGAMGRILRETNFSFNDHIAVDISRSFVIISKDNAVICYDLNGTDIASFRGFQSLNPKGIALDNDDIMYVCVWETPCPYLRQLSRNDTTNENIDTGIAWHSVCFNAAGNQMIAMNYDGTGTEYARRFNFEPRTEN